MYSNASQCCSDDFNNGVVVPYTVLTIILLAFLCFMLFVCVQFYRNWDVNFGRRQPSQAIGGASAQQRIEMTALPLDDTARDKAQVKSKPGKPRSTVGVVSDQSMVAEERREDDDEFSTILEQYSDRPRASRSTSIQESIRSTDQECLDFEHRVAIKYLSTLEPEPPAAFRSAEKYHMTMGLKKLDPNEWILIDKNYLHFHNVREQILNNVKLNSEAVRHGGREITGMEMELLELVATQLAEKYPQLFALTQRNGERFIRNKLTMETIALDRPSDVYQPLEAAVRIATEDLNILYKEGTQHKLVASATLFPAGWRLKDRSGSAITDLHHPVPSWKDTLSQPVEHFFDRLKPESPMRRDSLFIQVLHNTSIHPLSIKTLFIQKPAAFFQNIQEGHSIEAARIIIRRERQTFLRLPKTGAIVFGVRTRVDRLTHVSAEECEGLAAEVRTWPAHVWKYKGGHLWGKALLRYCDQVVEENMTKRKDSRRPERRELAKAE